MGRRGRASSASRRSSFALVLLAHAFHAFSVRPLVEWDGWAIWAMKARALYDFGGVAHGVFTTAPYGPLQHPLLLPALEATGFRSLGAFDGTLIHVQLALLAFGFAAACGRCCASEFRQRSRERQFSRSLAADSTLRQFAGNLADIPLAFFVALGVVALARCCSTGARLASGRSDHARRGDADEARGSAVRGGGTRSVRADPATRASSSRARRRGDPVAVAHLRRGPRSEEPGVQLRRRRRARLSRRPLRSRGPRAWGVWHQVWSSGWGLLVPFALVAFAAALLARGGVSPAFAAAWALSRSRDRARLLDLGRSDRADAQVGRLPHGRLARHRRCGAGAAPRRRGLVSVASART